MPGPFSVVVGDYSILVERGSLPQSIPAVYQRGAALIDEFDLASPDGEASFVAVGKSGERSSLVVAQRFDPYSSGFEPGVLLVPETRTLFIGAGVRLLAYSLDGPARLWEDTAHVGFWSWQQSGSFVLMSAELEMAAWDTRGTKLWTTMVEPPWDFTVEGDTVHLNVMTKRYHFSVSGGPSFETMG